MENLTKIYATSDGPLTALHQVSCSVPDGSFVSVLGPSGCGKSTLMLLIAGLIPMSDGAVFIADDSVSRPYTNLGIVFQEPVLLDWRTVIDNLMIQAEVRRLDKTKARARAYELLKSVGLAGFEHRRPYELSGGMRQRVSICRALMHDPPMLLMDEPFGALDALTRDQLNLEFQDLWLRTKKTVIFITHSIAEAVFLSDIVYIMSPRPGRIVDVLHIDLPRPRLLDIRETPEFGTFARQIRDIFTTFGLLPGSSSKRDGDETCQRPAAERKEVG